MHETIDIEAFVVFCKEQGLSVEKYELEIGFMEKSHISILDLPNGIRIDLNGVYTPWDKGVVEDAEEFDYEGIIIRIAKPEYLIANKLYKGGEIDFEDAFSVYIQNKDRLDNRLLKTLVYQLAVEESLEILLSKVNEIENMNK